MRDLHTRRPSQRRVARLTAGLLFTLFTGLPCTVAAQNDPPLPPSLKTVPVPEPRNLNEFIRDREVAVVLGKALFWDMQVGSDGQTACATCHFNAGADSRSKNQVSPGLNKRAADGSPLPDRGFDLGPNRALQAADFPLRVLSDPTDRASPPVLDTNDVVSSQGVFSADFQAVSGEAADKVTFLPDPDGFQVGGVNVRRVEPRNTPTVINAVFNFRNFWDGRAQNDFNGVNAFGSRETEAYLYRARTHSELEPVQVSLNNASLASQAVMPPVNAFEMSAHGRILTDVGEKLARTQRGIWRRTPRLRPLAQQQVHRKDSVLGRYSRFPKPGLSTPSYNHLIQQAFQPQWWRSSRYIQIAADGTTRVVPRPDDDPRTDEYTLMEYNFSLFFGLAIQMYEATLIADDTPFDRFLAGDATAVSEAAARGADLFRSQTRGRCINCHAGPELTDASVSAVSASPLRIREGQALDRGFNNIGVRPTLEDLGVGGEDPFGNPLSTTRLLSPPPAQPIAVDGAFKAPGLRNVELTAPYFHNGGILTLTDVIEFYSRGGDLAPIVTPDGLVIQPLHVLNLTQSEKDDLLAFLLSLTDERVRYRRAPFDHPQLFVPNGQLGDETAVVDDGTGQAVDSFLEIQAVGREGGPPLPRFLE
jgi:cytochrome c peroxidase